MATVTIQTPFTSGQTNVDHNDLNGAINNASVSDIVDADIHSSAAIEPTKLDLASDFDFTANVKIGSSGIDISQVRHGTATLAAGTVTVNDTTITANSIIIVTPQANPTGRIYEDTASRVVGTSFDIKSSASEAITVAYMIIEP